MVLRTEQWQVQSRIRMGCSAHRRRNGRWKVVGEVLGMGSTRKARCYQRQGAARTQEPRRFRHPERRIGPERGAEFGDGEVERGVGQRHALARCLHQRELDAGALATLLQNVRGFDAFNADNDPHGEHDFGSIEQAGIRYFWKIDNYDLAHEFHSPDASNPDVTRRVMMIMRADEY